MGNASINLSGLVEALGIQVDRDHDQPLLLPVGWDSDPVSVETVGNLALAPKHVPSNPSDHSVLPAIIPAASAMVAAERDGAAQSAIELLPTRQKAVVLEQLEFSKAVWTLWRGGGGLTFEQAYNAVVARVARGDYKALAERGKFSLAVVRDVWLPKLTDKRTGAPVWDAHRLVFRYRDGGVKQAQTKALPASWCELFTARYLTRGVRSLRQVWEFACTRCIEEGMVAREDLPAYHQARYFAQHKIPRRLIDQYRVPQAEKAQIGGYILRKWRNPGEIWMMDHHRLDLRCKVPIPGHDDEWALLRPWITVVRDAASGFILAVLVYVDQAPNHERIVETLYRALVVAGGVPCRVLVIDNGKDFLRRGVCTDLVLRAAVDADSALDACDAALGDVEYEDRGDTFTHSVARELGIEVRRMRPYAGRQKPVERDFRNVAHDFAKLFPAWVYTGHNPVTRPSESPKEDQRVQREPRQYPSVQQAQDALEAWLARMHQMPSNGRLLRGLSPAQAWAGRPEPHRPPLPERALQLACLIPQKPLVGVKPGPSGADIWHRGWWYWGATDADCLALAAYHASGPDKQVLIKTAFNDETFPYGNKRLPFRVFAFEPDGRFIAECHASEEFDALDASRIPDQAEGFRAACRRIALLKSQAKRQREGLTAGLTERKIGPVSTMEFAGLAGAQAPPQLPPGAESAPRALVAAPEVPGPGRGRARVVQGECKTAAEPSRSPRADPALMAAFQESLACRSEQSDLTDRSDQADRSIDFAAFMRAPQDQ